MCDGMCRACDAAGAIFDRTKLEWLNAHWMRALPPDESKERLRPFVVARLGVSNPPDQLLVSSVMNLSTRANTLVEVAEQGRFYFEAPTAYDPRATGNLVTPPLGPRLDLLLRRLHALEPWDAVTLEGVCRQLAAELGVKLVDLAQPVRLALTGRTASPPIFEVMADLGRDETLARLRALRGRVPAA